MKVIAYTALLYGLDFYYYALRSVIDYVQEYYVLYSPVGSHGSQASRPCPETRDQLYSVAQLVAGSKLHWIDGAWAHEGLQRMTIHEVCPDADVILVLDADEVWPYGDKLPDLIYEAWNKQYHDVRLPMVHFWRSFNRAVLHDPAFPTRIVIPHTGNHDSATLGDKPIAHMGYAQRPDIVQYKLETHGHRGEFRKDCDWFHDKFMTNAQVDVHPVGSEYWNPEPVNPWDYLPEMMKTHPYVGLEVIG